MLRRRLSFEAAFGPRNPVRKRIFRWIVLPACVRQKVIGVQQTLALKTLAVARDNLGMNDPTARTEQPRNPLHGVTLEAIVRTLEAHYGWEELARKIPVRCFSHEPSVSSSLKFLRKTPWAREKVESLYLFVLREQARRERAGP